MQPCSEQKGRLRASLAQTASVSLISKSQPVCLSDTSGTHLQCKPVSAPSDLCTVRGCQQRCQAVGGWRNNSVQHPQWRSSSTPSDTSWSMCGV
eukprot:COSAG06_NODE_1245_length_10117_cov_28.671990_15_plen_94_part_00